jgi:cytochrome c oxidase subunit 3
VGLIWPTTGVVSLDPFSVPLLNTLILVSSGATLTVAHHYLVRDSRLAVSWLLFTVVLGIVFTLCQLFEYAMASFTFSIRNYGSIFFIATGFHGLHVLVGTLLLSISLVKIVNVRYNISHHVSLELRA